MTNKICSLLICLALILSNFVSVNAKSNTSVDDIILAIEETEEYLLNGIVADGDLSEYKASNGISVTMKWHDIYDNTIADEKGSYKTSAYLSETGKVTIPKWYEGTKILKASAELCVDEYSAIVSNVKITIEPDAAPKYNARNLSDYIDIGNVKSEYVTNDDTITKRFECVRDNGIQTITVDGVEHTYRTLNKNGAMVVNMKCDPDKVNYLTVKLWGNDTGNTMLWVCDPETGYMNTGSSRQPTRNSLVDRRDWVELNFVSSSPQYNGGFIYSTYMIPTVYTKGKNYVSLRIYSTGGSSDYGSVSIKEQTMPSRGIYAVYMTQNPIFDLTDFETVTGKKVKSAQVETIPYDEQKTIFGEYAKNAIDVFKTWQIYGGENYPSYMEGMVTRGTSWKQKSIEDTNWKNAFYSSMVSQNLTPLNMYEIFAHAYKNSDVFGYTDTEKIEFLDRCVKGVDFLARAQGDNGGFYSSIGWIGGPERVKSSGHHLSGFALRSVGEALMLLYDDISENGYFEEYIDSDADGFKDKNRKDAWENMIVPARDFLVSLDGAGHAPNQDMADIIAALKFEKVLQMMNSSYSWKVQGMENEIENYLDIALGFKTNIACSSYWVSPKGLILENFGSIQGGYSGDYGIAALAEMSQLVEFAQSYFGNESETTQKYVQRLNDAYSTAANFMFIANADNGSTPTLYSEGIISNRNSYYPGTVRYVTDKYAAVDIGNKAALKNFEMFFNHNRALINSEGYLPSNAHFEDNALEIVKLYLDFDKIISAFENENYTYPMENDEINSFAWADEMGRNLVIKNGSERIYLALNWRNPIHSTKVYNTENICDNQSGLANNLARFHYTNDVCDRYGYAEMSTVGWNVQTATKADFKTFENHYMEAFMYMQFGDYTILMNSNNLMGNENNIDYDIPVDELNLDGLYMDMISGNYYSFGANVEGAYNGEKTSVKSGTTMVLYPVENIPCETIKEIIVKKAEYADGVVSAEISTGENKDDVYVYIAEYNSDKALVGIKLKNQYLDDDAVISFDYDMIDQSNTVKIFVWNSEQKPYKSDFVN